MQTIERLISWVVLSSKDSSKFSLTLKSVLVWVLAYFGLSQFDLSHTLALLQQTVEYISMGMALYGAWRKMASTWKGTNAVLNDPML